MERYQMTNQESSIKDRGEMKITKSEKIKLHNKDDVNFRVYDKDLELIVKDGKPVKTKS